MPEAQRLTGTMTYIEFISRHTSLNLYFAKQPDRSELFDILYTIVLSPQSARHKQIKLRVPCMCTCIHCLSPRSLLQSPHCLHIYTCHQQVLQDEVDRPQSCSPCCMVRNPRHVPQGAQSACPSDICLIACCIRTQQTAPGDPRHAGCTPQCQPHAGVGVPGQHRCSR